MALHGKVARHHRRYAAKHLRQGVVLYGLCCCLQPLLSVRTSRLLDAVLGSGQHAAQHEGDVLVGHAGAVVLQVAPTHGNKLPSPFLVVPATQHLASKVVPGESAGQDDMAAWAARCCMALRRFLRDNTLH